MIHGTDKRISLERLRDGIRMMHELVTKLVSAKDS
jgi:hypothetical protein